MDEKAEALIAEPFETLLLVEGAGRNVTLGEQWGEQQAAAKEGGKQEASHDYVHYKAVREYPQRLAMKVPLSQLAHTRSGDKGDTCNIGVIALREADYPVLVREVTAERVKRHFGDRVQGAVERFELPNLGALNFLLHGALGGGGTVSLRTDAQGKVFGAALLALEIEVAD